MTNRILIVDDETAFTQLIKLNLEATGKFDVFIENNPREALSTALSVKPDLILIDIIMPFMEGPDVVMQMRNDENLQYTPVIFLTATVTREEVVSQSGRIGGNKFVAKPSSLKDLLVSIESSLVRV